jgi:hypothetical protein
LIVKRRENSVNRLHYLPQPQSQPQPKLKADVKKIESPRKKEDESKKDELDLFFNNQIETSTKVVNKKESNHLNSSTILWQKSEEEDDEDEVDNIQNKNDDPNELSTLKKEDKIRKLQSSVENLRRELQLNDIISKQESNPPNKFRMEEIKRKYSAIKIQKWFKNIKKKESNDRQMKK